MLFQLVFRDHHKQKERKPEHLLAGLTPGPDQRAPRWCLSPLKALAKRWQSAGKALAKRCNAL